MTVSSSLLNTSKDKTTFSVWCLCSYLIHGTYVPYVTVSVNFRKIFLVNCIVFNAIRFQYAMRQFSKPGFKSQENPFLRQDCRTCLGDCRGPGRRGRRACPSQCRSCPRGGRGRTPRSSRRGGSWRTPRGSPAWRSQWGGRACAAGVTPPGGSCRCTGPPCTARPGTPPPPPQHCAQFKGTVPRDFWLQVFLMNQFPQAPSVQ